MMENDEDRQSFTNKEIKNDFTQTANKENIYTRKIVPTTIIIIVI